MFKLDNNFLISMGLGSLPVAEKNKLLQAIYERLEMNVGMRLAERMTEEQLTEFEQFMNQKDEAGALRWLESNFPNYKQVVAEELDKLKNEVTQAAPQILAASQAEQPQPSRPTTTTPANYSAQDTVVTTNSQQFTQNPQAIPGNDTVPQYRSPAISQPPSDGISSQQPSVTAAPQPGQQSGAPWTGGGLSSPMQTDPLQAGQSWPQQQSGASQPDPYVQPYGDQSTPPAEQPPAGPGQQ